MIIEPAGARDAGAGWRLSPEAAYRISGAQRTGMSAGNYTLQLKTVAGFQPPNQQSVRVNGGQVPTVTFAYEAAVAAPAISSAGAVSGLRGQPFNYQIAGTSSPSSFNVSGTLPPGLSLDTGTGLITGTPTGAGVFGVTISASNAGGSGTMPLTITINHTALDQWRLANLGTTANAAAAADASDPDKDGLTNLVEFAFGLDPNQSSTSLLPVWQRSGSNMSMSFTPPAGVSGISYIAEQSSGLSPGGWTPSPTRGCSPKSATRFPSPPAPPGPFSG